MRYDHIYHQMLRLKVSDYLNINWFKLIKDLNILNDG